MFAKKDEEFFSKTIRKIPKWVIDGIDRICATSERLPEAEMRFALGQHVRFHDNQVALAEMQEKDAAVLRAREVGERLREMLAIFNKGLPESLRFSDSRLAQALGETTVSSVAQWVAGQAEPTFTGQAEPTFKTLSAIADLTGSSDEWLIHNTGAMFRYKDGRIDEYAPNGAADIINSPRFREIPVKIALLRHTTSGDFSFVRLFSNGRWELQTTPYKISEKVGSGGESSLNHLALTLAALYKLWVRAGSNSVVPNIKSYNVDDETYKQILSGVENVRYLIEKECNEAPWWEDIWDAGGLKHNHFDGYSDLAGRIQARIASNKTLIEVMEKIRSENYEFMSSIKIKTYSE